MAHCCFATAPPPHCLADLAATVQNLHLATLFRLRDRSWLGEYWLQSLVGFYGQHYFAFVRQQDDTWLQFDDATVCRPPRLGAQSGLHGTLEHFAAPCP